MAGDNALTQRRSFRLIGGLGTFDVEINRLEGSGLEVVELDEMGRPLTAIIVHTWDDARARAAELVAIALRDGRV